jgi:hypothetical protein
VADCSVCEQEQEGDEGLVKSLCEWNRKLIIKRWYRDRVCSILKDAPGGEAGWFGWRLEAASEGGVG